VTHAGYVFAGYAATAVVLAAYAGWIISRTRKLTGKDEVNGPGGRSQPATIGRVPKGVDR
jgi:hypothetical protein